MSFIDHAAWGSFSRALTAKQISWIENRLRYLQETLPSYVDRNLSDSDLSDLDLDLTTFLATSLASDGESLTPWLVHSDWFAYIDPTQLSSEVLSLIRMTQQATGRSEIDTINGNLKLLFAVLEVIAGARNENDAVACLACLDQVALHALVCIGDARLRSLSIRDEDRPPPT